MGTGPGTPALRNNYNGARFVVGKNVDGAVGLFVNNGEIWLPFDEHDLRDCRTTLGAKPGEILYVSIYRMTE